MARHLGGWSNARGREKGALLGSWKVRPASREFGETVIFGSLCRLCNHACGNPHSTTLNQSRVSRLRRTQVGIGGNVACLLGGATECFAPKACAV